MLSIGVSCRIRKKWNETFTSESPLSMVFDKGKTRARIDLTDSLKFPSGKSKYMK